MLFWAHDLMTTDAYIILREITKSPYAITHCGLVYSVPGVRFYYRWDESQPYMPRILQCLIRPAECQREHLLTLRRSYDCRRRAYRLEVGNDWGAGFGRREGTRQVTVRLS